ncbi:MAG: redoxin domain-containing protein [Armatimonadetes bacterium]|nr:redoxin domain-containing protein [Armatimonadota bacterium]MDE2207416.1 redoxin domain-containing protein [Armatimonadota bacterium]
MVVSCVFAGAQQKPADPELKVGDMAPDFTLPDQTNTPRHLFAERGHTVVLAFYPADDTPG